MHELLKTRLYATSDATIYIPREKNGVPTAADGFEKYCRDRSRVKGDGPISYPFSDDDGTSRRFLVCPCMRGQYWSVTVRSDRKADGSIYQYQHFQSYFEPAQNQYAPDRSHSLEDSNGFLFSFNELSSALHRLLFPDLDSAKGLLVVTGGTSAGKSQITRGIIYHHLRQLCEKTYKLIEKRDTKYPRKPHLLTYEDPIEELFCKNYFKQDNWKDAPFDYTPRQKSFDVTNLTQAFGDALRQTPKIFFVGEVRDPNDWRLLLDFAATGHLVITTAHAGGLREALSKVFGKKLQTPGDRAEVAGRLLGVVHLTNRKCEGFGVTFPALYRKTTSGIQNLVGVGLASILPNYPANKDTGTLGRQACFDEICRLSRDSALDTDDRPPKKNWHRVKLRRYKARREKFDILRREPNSPARHKALEMDLEGV